MAKKRAVTVQKASNTTPHMGGFTLPLTFLSATSVAPEWEAGDRDSFLRIFWKRFGNDMLQGVIATAVAKVQTQNWQLEGPKRLVQMYHRFLRDEADFHRGYDSLVSRGLQDYYTQDNGWFIERFRANRRDKSGPALGFAHMDSQRVKATGNIDYPWYYEDVGGEYHLMHRSQVIRIVDLPTPSTEMWSDERGFCALSRTLSTAMILTMIVAMKREKLADLPPSALAIFNNISRKQFENSLKLKGAEDDMANNMLYRQLLPLFGIDPAHPASVQFLSLREVWEGFSDEEAMNMAAYSFAAGFRMDPREFWPVSQGTLGTGKEAEVQHQKAKGKGHGLIFTSMERGLNANDSLPKNVKFKFAIQDADEEEQRAKIHSMQIGNIEGMQKAGAGLVPAEVRYLLVKKYKVIPQELLVPPEEGKEPELIIADVYMDDVERQAKEYGGWYFGPVVTMDYDGTIWRKAAWDSARKELPDGPLFIGNKGGAGSGNFGHGGRPGLVGGSGGSGGVSAQIFAVENLMSNMVSRFGVAMEYEVVDDLNDTSARQLQGFDFGSKAAGVYDPEANKLFMSRNWIEEPAKRAGEDPGGSIHNTAWLGPEYLSAHEYAHGLDKELNISGNMLGTVGSGDSKWQSIAKNYLDRHGSTRDWETDRYIDHDSVLSKYSLGFQATVETEGFAEAFAVYVNNPSWLKTNQPAMYDYMADLEVG